VQRITSAKDPLSFHFFINIPSGSSTRILCESTACDNISALQKGGSIILYI
jgi:hypothetical protein